MGVETTELNAYAVIWPFTGRSTSDGSEVLDSPREIRVREERNRRNSVAADATRKTVDATLYVAEEVVLGSQVWIGRLADLPDPLVDLLVVVGYDRVPDLKNNKVRRTILLSRKR